MSSPFDYIKSVTQTKEDLFTNDEIFKKEYNAFIVNRGLSNSETTALFADAMNQHPNLDPYLQYKFYLTGIPKSRNYSKWIKKEAINKDENELQFIAEQLNVSIKRALILHDLIGSEKIKELIDLRGGKAINNGKQKI
jgi:hypothetical protein